MKLKIKKIKLSTGRPVCIINEKTAKKIGIHTGDRISIKAKNKKIISIVDTVSKIIKLNEIAVSEIIFKYLNLRNKAIVEIELTEKPKTIDLIKKKLRGDVLNKKEIKEIIKNIADNLLTESEVAFFISAVYTEGMSLNEIQNLIKAMVKTGNQMKIKGKIADKHSIGGVAGNRTTPIIVSICASAGLIIPKTSSRAITSAAGTADVIESIARVNFSINQIKKIIKKTNACFVWGGTLGLAPVDDKLIKIERIVNIDSTAQLLASIISKKISAGSKYILIDIPYGKSAKVSRIKAEKLKKRFLYLGKRFNLKFKVVLTDGSEPIGNGIGPILEIRDVIKILKRKSKRKNYPKDLEQKSLMLSGKLLELYGKAKKNKGIKLAKEILDSGKAFEKFNQIIIAQKGKITESKLKPAEFSYDIIAKNKTKIKHLNNKLINKLARYLGSPEDKSAGIFFYKKKGDVAEKKEKIMTMYSISKEKLKYAKKFFSENKNKIIKGI